MQKIYPTLETERLYLRPTDETDTTFLLELLNMPKWLKNIGDRNVHTIEDAKKYVQERMLPQLERLGHSSFTVIRKSDGVKMGSCGLYDREGLEGVDIGFAFLPPYEGKGYGFECAEKVKTVGIEEWGIKRISAITIPSNKASQRLIEKLGLVFVEMTRLPNDEEELMLYRLDV